MMLPAPAVSPPIRLPEADPKISTPWPEITQSRRSRNIEANVVAGDYVTRRGYLAISVNDNAVPNIAGDDIALPGSSATNFSPLHSVIDHDTMTGIADCRRAIIVGADIVAEDLIVVSAGVVNFNAIADGTDLSGYDITFTGRSITTDGVVVGTSADIDAICTIAKTTVTGNVNTNVVALDDIKRAATSPE